jgi:TPP-dependent indolepyruvate ferredoxin oxidoreductase alpha subunit
MSDGRLQRMSMDELEAEGGTALPAKEVISLLDLDLDLDLALALAAPVDLAIAANASVGSESIAIADQNPVIEQQLDDVTARAEADQDAKVIQ